MQLDLELYREQVEVEPDVIISLIDVIPERRQRTIILIHGFGGNALQWQYQIEAFAQEHRVIAIDLRGHGRSSRPSKGYQMSRIIDDIVAVLEQREVHGRFVLAGHSFGVAVTTEFACAHPERLSHLILIAGAGEYELRKSYRLGLWMPSWLLHMLQPVAKSLVDFDASLQALKRFYRHNLRDWQGWDLFPQLAMPVLVLLGNRDEVLSREAFERVGELVPEDSSEVIQVGVSAHMVMLERRDAVNRAVLRFIAAPAKDSHDASWRGRFFGHGRKSLLRERPWLAKYAPDVPATIHVPEQPLPRLMQRAAGRFPDRTAIMFNGKHISYKALWEEAIQFAWALIEYGFKPGERVQLLLPNMPQLIIAYYGTLLAGGVVVLSNHLGETAESVRQAQITGARVLVTLNEHAKLAAEIAERCELTRIVLARSEDYLPWWRKLFGRTVGSGPKSSSDAQTILPAALATPWPAFLDKKSTEPPTLSQDPQQTAVIQFTAGTSGTPRGVMLSHFNLLANVMQLRAWLTHAEDGVETALGVTPFSHAYGMTAAMNVPIS